MCHNSVLWLLLFLTIANGNPVTQFDTDNRKPLFENSDFKIFRVENYEALGSIAKEAEFGVLVVRDDSSQWDMQACHFCFIGATGNRNFLMYGTSRYLISESEKYFRGNRSHVWIAIKSDAKMVKQVFDEKQPNEYKNSVREDLLFIGFLADKAAEGAWPTEREQRRASAALEDLSIKSNFASFNSVPAPRIKVKVRTLRSGEEEGKWTVWYVATPWEGDKDHTYTFDQLSSPTEQQITPGSYSMWATRGKKKGTVKTVKVGDTPDLTKELDLEIP